MIALSLWVVTAVGAGVLLCGSAVKEDTMARVTRDHAEVGLEALKDSKLIKAEHEFALAGDHARLAEVYNRQGRYDEAKAEASGREDGQAKLMLALACQGRGELNEYRRRLVEARNLGNHAALCLLAVHEAADADGAADDPNLDDGEA